MIAAQLIKELDRFNLDIGYVNDTSKSVTIRDISEVDGNDEVVYALSVDIRALKVSDLYKQYRIINTFFSVTRTFPEFTASADASGVQELLYPEKKHCRGYFTGTASLAFGRAVGLLSDGNLMYSYNLIIRSNKIGY